MTASQKELQSALLYFAYCGKAKLFGQEIESGDAKLGRELAGRFVKGGDPLSIAEEAQAFELVKKYRKPLAKAGVKVPKKLPDRLEIEQQEDGIWLVSNCHKGTGYTVTIAEGQSTCTCPQFKFKRDCKHLKAVWQQEFATAREREIVLEEESEGDLLLGEQFTSRELTESGSESPPAEIVDNEDNQPALATADIEIDIPDVLPGIQLTVQQWQSLQELEAFVEGDERLYLLTGYAGTGKSTLLQALIVRLQEMGDDRTIALTAFTNKAKKVLESMTAKWGLDVDCLTCCQLLGIRPAINPETGQQEFKPDRAFQSQIDKYALVVVDECSTIGEEMWAALLNAVTGLFKDVKLLFVGDRAQLPPVNETESPCFEQIGQATHLTEVVRYGNAIGRVADRLRQNIHAPYLPRFHSQVTKDGNEGVMVMEAREWHRSLMDVFERLQGGGEFERVRALAYTNKRVAALNGMIRRAVYGDRAGRFVVGERLMAYSPCLRDDTVLLSSSAECTVQDVQMGRYEGWRVWNLEIEDEEGRWRQLRVLHEGMATEFQRRLRGLADAAQWKEFWELKNGFHDLRYAYALTVHKSQGSSFEEVYVDVRNFEVNRSAVERNKLCYVA
ncbi:MAG: ATP-dependent RecD-like DNA helicase, partial [Synechococcus sp.]